MKEKFRQFECLTVSLSEAENSTWFNRPTGRRQREQEVRTSTWHKGHIIWDMKNPRLYLKSKRAAEGFKQVWSTWKVWYAFQNPPWPRGFKWRKVEIHATTYETFYSLPAVSPPTKFFSLPIFPAQSILATLGSVCPLAISSSCLIQMDNFTFVKSLLKFPFVYEAWLEDQNSAILPYPALHSLPNFVAFTALWCTLYYFVSLGSASVDSTNCRLKILGGKKNRANLEKGNLNFASN